MNETLYIPKRIKIGFNKRQDTYTEKLGYVIYWDDKGVLRQENSWEGWRDKTIDPLEFDNVPTEGFVLNRGVGGARQSYGWNVRNEYVRVYDPRGFEFEISVSNLLFILQECTSTKGKGLEGEFVYSWSGKNLVLLPVESKEYRESTKFTNNLQGKVDKSLMIPGKTYLFKNTVSAIYLGRHEVNINKEFKRTKKHVFIRSDFNLDNDLRLYLFYESGFTKISKVLIDEVCESYSDLLERFIESEFHQKMVRIEKIPHKMEKLNLSKYGYSTIEEFLGINNNQFIKVFIYYFYNPGNHVLMQSSQAVKIIDDKKLDEYYPRNDLKIPLGVNEDEVIESLKKYTFYNIFYIFENGKKINYNKLRLI